MPQPYVGLSIRVMTVAAAALAAGCASDASTAPAPPTVTYHVVYALTGSSGVAFDSLEYEDGQGALVRIPTPAAGWRIALSEPAGAYVHAALWGRALTGAQSVALTVTWASAAGSKTDRTIVELAGPGPFTLDLGRTQL